MDGLQWHVARGERQAALEALSKILAANIEDTPPQYLSALSSRLQDVMREIAELKAEHPTEVDLVDEVEKKRAARKQQSKDSESTG